MKYLTVLALAMLAGGMACVVAVGAAEVPAGGRNILGPIMQKEAESGKHGRAQVLDLDEGPFRKVLQAETYGKGNDWDLQVSEALAEAVGQDDVLLLAFHARTMESADESGQSLIYAGLEVPEQWKLPDAEKAKLHPITRRVCVAVGDGWTHYVLPLRAPRDFASGELMFNMRCGLQGQKVQFADIKVLNYRKAIDYADLPETKPTYAGREKGAEWREAALARIEKLRKGDMEILVRDASGAPVPNAGITVELKRHSFGFGAAFPAACVVESNQDNLVYRGKILDNFSSASFVNELKWPAVAGDWGPKHPGLAIEALRWVQSEKLPFRGHCLVWPRLKSVSKELRRMLEQENPDPDAIQEKILRHIRHMAELTSFWMQEWDVLNESIPCQDVQRICGDKVMVEWFNEARKAMPGVALALNEYALLSSLTDTKKMEQHEDRIRYLLENKAPLDVLGFQGHFGGQPPSPVRILNVLDRFGKFGLKMRVTEFDTKIDDPALQYDFARDFYIALFSHPQVVGVQHWGIVGTVFDKDLNYTATGKAHRDMVLDAWHTREVGRTDREGRFRYRGFLGEYEATVDVGGGKVLTVPFRLVQGKGLAEVEIEAK